MDATANKIPISAAIAASTFRLKPHRVSNAASALNAMVLPAATHNAINITPSSRSSPTMKKAFWGNWHDTGRYRRSTLGSRTSRHPAQDGILALDKRHSVHRDSYRFGWECFLLDESPHSRQGYELAESG